MTAERLVQSLWNNYKIGTTNYGTRNKNVERNNGAMILFSGVMRKRTIDSFSSFRPVPGVQKRSECCFFC